MITPSFLKRGDKVAIIAPARKVSKNELKFAIDILQDWGLIPVESPNLFKEFNQFAGSDEEREADLIWALRNEDVKAIFCARGGYGSVRTIQNINSDLFVENPKWIIGFSDITVLHLYLNKTGVQSVHGSMPLTFPEVTSRSLDRLKDILFGESDIDYEFEGNSLNVEGEATGELIGGNLSVIYSLRGTKFEPDYSGKILFIEDLDEYLYHIDRMMMNLKTGGILTKLKGIIVGDMLDMHDNTIPFGFNANEIIYNHTHNLGIPIAFISGIGHGSENLPLVFGKKITLKVINTKTILSV